MGRRVIAEANSPPRSRTSNRGLTRDGVSVGLSISGLCGLISSSVGVQSKEDYGEWSDEV